MVLKFAPPPSEVFLRTGAGVMLNVLLLLTLTAAAGAQQQPQPQRIEIRYYGDVSCAHCDTFVSSYVPELEARYSVSLEVTTLDILRAKNRSECERLLARYDREYRIFPVLFIGNNAYQGNAAIEAHLPREIEHWKETGSFRPRLSAAQSTASAASPAEPPPLHGEDRSADRLDLLLHYFWAEGCPACARAAPFLDELQVTYPRLQIERYEVTHNPENLELYRQTARRRGADAMAVPAFFLPDSYWIGFNTNNAEEITAAVQFGLTTGRDDVDQPRHGLAREHIDLPLFGRVSLETAPAFVVTGAIAAVDGFNPCSLWVLTFLIGLIIRTGSRRRTLAVGMVFLLVTASVYGLFILGLFTVFAAAGGVPAVRIVVAVMALAMGLVNMKDYFAFKAGFSLTIPERFQPLVARWGRSVFGNSASPPALVAATALFAFGISVIELPCTAGFPLIWSQYVASLGAGGGTFAALFAVYLLIYLAAEILVVVASVVFMQRLSFGERQARVLKLLAGTIMASLGTAYLVFPAATRTMSGVALVFGAASAVTLLILAASRVYGAASRSVVS